MRARSRSIGRRRRLRRKQPDARATRKKRSLQPHVSAAPFKWEVAQLPGRESGPSASARARAIQQRLDPQGLAVLLAQAQQGDIDVARHLVERAANFARFRAALRAEEQQRADEFQRIA